jgi:two-component system chemotaxis response regulator CheY
MAKSILIIDDDILILTTVKRLLAREGHSVTTALNGATALRKIKEGSFDLIISDIKMPKMSGIETVKKIREYLVQNNKSAIPEIFITGYAKEDVYQEALKLNAAGYVEKPFDIKTLVETVKDTLSTQNY